MFIWPTDVITEKSEFGEFVLYRAGYFSDFCLNNSLDNSLD